MVQLWRPLLVTYFAAATAQAGGDLFRERVAPILEARCIYCHSGTKPKGGLSLVSAVDISRGGDSGAVVVANQPEESLLLAFISGDNPQMPQEGEALQSADVATIRQWIEAGAHWPDGLQLADKRPYDLDWWSLRPLVHSEVPPIESAWIRH